MSQRPRIYLDHAATTPILPAARAAMVEAMGRWANPSSPHAEGRAARAALEDARERIKRALGWEGELIFTSGATEAIEIALTNRAETVLATGAEHDAVIRLIDERNAIGVHTDGLIDDGALGLEHALAREGKKVISIQTANNETGVLQPLNDVARQMREAGDCLLFSDCAQTAGKLSLPPADMMAVSAHKLGGAPGAGALLLRDFGLLRASGGQERGYRPGTENLPAILSFAVAVETQDEWMNRASVLRRKLEQRLQLAGAEIVAIGAPRIPTIGSYRMSGVPAASQLIHFDLAGIAVSAGSACSSGSLKPSRVLGEMGWTEDESREVVRVSFGPQTTEAEIDAFATSWEELAERQRAA